MRSSGRCSAAADFSVSTANIVPPSYQLNRFFGLPKYDPFCSPALSMLAIRGSGVSGSGRGDEPDVLGCEPPWLGTRRADG